MKYTLSSDVTYAVIYYLNPYSTHSLVFVVRGGLASCHCSVLSFVCDNCFD